MRRRSPASCATDGSSGWDARFARPPEPSQPNIQSCAASVTMALGRLAGVVESVDTPALGAGGASHGGSSPSARMLVAGVQPIDERTSPRLRLLARGAGSPSRPQFALAGTDGSPGRLAVNDPRRGLAATEPLFESPAVPADSGPADGADGADGAITLNASPWIRRLPSGRSHQPLRRRGRRLRR